MSKTIIKRDVQRLTYYISNYDTDLHSTYQNIGEETVYESEPINMSFNKDDLIYVESLGKEFRVRNKSFSLNGDEIYNIAPKTVEDEISKMTKEMCEENIKRIKKLLKSNDDKNEIIAELTKGFWGKRRAKKLGI